MVTCVYYDLNADLLNKLDRLLNKCIRFVYKLRKYGNVSTFRSQLNWLTIRQRRSMRALTTLFSFLNSPSPPAYFTSLFQYLSSFYNKHFRSSNNLLLLWHLCFVIQSFLLWNAHLQEIRMATSRWAVKFKVREYIRKDLLAPSSSQ